MAVLVVGSTAFDTVETPYGVREDCLGGSSTYFGLAAVLFTEVRLVSVVGEDFPDSSRKLLADRGMRLEGLEVQPGRTFRWSGKYSADMNSRETLDVDALSRQQLPVLVGEILADDTDHLDVGEPLGGEAEVGRGTAQAILAPPERGFHGIERSGTDDEY